MPATESNRLLKSVNLRELGSKVAFNYEDLKGRCENYIEGIRTEAQQILTDAQIQADQMRKDAKQQGREEGITQGRQEGQRNIEAEIDAAADQKATDQLRTTLPAIAETVKALDAERNGWLATWQERTIQLSVAIAEKLLSKELQQRPELAKEAIIEALDLAAGNPHIELQMNPTDIEFLGIWSEEIIKTISPAGDAKVVSNPAISPGGCVIKTKHGKIDAGIETKLARIAEELLDNRS